MSARAIAARISFILNAAFNAFEGASTEGRFEALGARPEPSLGRVWSTKNLWQLSTVAAQQTIWAATIALGLLIAKSSQSNRSALAPILVELLTELLDGILRLVCVRIAREKCSRSAGTGSQG